ncbi:MULTISPECIES: glycosyltransferase family 2 protein [Pseudomonas]|uniref:Glycosyltransferase family 2 protein n=1 Tax=Pseudomonas izuensis TaxID=2684212 RepID=A0ABM7S2J5_9PSED|nr:MULTISPECIES: glycosyltransferase family 2 protein [Pseudomonas]RKS27978.1 glycosyltransferase involved in cell wall biosynthesis [Pseudomonas sp. WPR_5_2]BCX68692.1 glycosyltransferase family 2 protein [Pseudomonas izuensis]
MLKDAPSSPASVCVVIPMYNAASTIEKTLASLIQQTRQPEQVIVVDDGSSDDGAQRVRDFVAPFRLTLLQQTNQGPACARNAGIFAAEQTFIAFLDADDQWHPQKLEMQLALYERLTAQGHSVGLIDCYQLSVFSDGKQQREERRKCGHHFADFMRENVINGTSGVLVVREVVCALGGFDASLRFAEDRLLWTRIAEHWEIHTVPQTLHRRGVDSGNITAQPQKYYPYKVKFIELFLARYGARMTRQQRIHFVLANHADFLNAFSRRGDHAQVIQVFRQMLGHSWQALIFFNGKPTLRYLYARLKTLRKVS